MSKAFTREDNDLDSDDELDEDSAIARLPKGKNYITPGGETRLRNELHQLLKVERPKLVETIAWAAGNGDRSENADYIYGKRRLREIDRRIRFLSKRLEIAEVVNPAKQTSDRIRFGATVSYQPEDGDEKTVTIVGIDETNLGKGHISWISPLGSALLNARVGDTVTFRSPKGIQELEITSIIYSAIE